LVDNPKDQEAAVHGTLLFQRKGTKDTWEDTSAIPLSTLKRGEGVRLDLHASEVLTLFKEVAELYKLHARDGIPLGETELIRADSVVAKLSKLQRGELRVFLDAHRSVGQDLLGNLLVWAAEIESPGTLIPRLVGLGSNVLRSLNAAVGLSALKRALAIWDANAANTNEEFWQTTLTENSFVLEQVFSWPTTIVKGKAYVGGKSILNTGGNVVDFLVKNYLTNNAALVEIKTPGSPLLGRKYRDGIYSPSTDLVGSMMQLLDYRYSLQREFYSLTHGAGSGLEAFEPKCVAIVGSTHEIRGDEIKTRSLELMRNASSAVAIITFDELFEKTRRLISVLEATADPGA
jgi:hypothetical protein